MNRKTGVRLLCVCAVVLGFYLARRADQASRTPTTPAEVATSQVIGTWRADGSFFQFRSDSTARSRDPDYPSDPIHYFEWETDGDIFTVYWAPRGTIKRALASISGMQKDSFDLKNLTDDSFTLIEPAGKTEFSRTTDSLLDEAP